MELDIRPSGPNGTEATLALNGIREAGATTVFERMLKGLKEQTTGTIHVFDVGAHVGYYALLEARILGERGQIYAIEAEPNNAKRLRNNVALNEYATIDVIQAAAGSERTRKELSVRSRSNLHRMSEVLEGKDRVAVADVDVYPLDSLIADRQIPDEDVIIVRMDVEGYETHVFEGMSELFSADRPVYLFIEIHPSRDAVDVSELLDTLCRNDFKPEYATVDGDIQPINSFERVRSINSNTHLMASRLINNDKPSQGV